MTRRRKLQLLVLCLVVSVSGGVAYAALSGQTSNSGNTFSAAANFGGSLRMASGTYDGNGVDNRSITGLGFQPDVVIVKGNVADVAMLRTSSMAAGMSKRMVGGNAVETNKIQAFEADGFQVGTDNSVNDNGFTFYWTAFKAEPGAVKVGSYTGNGTTQAVTGVGFSPEYVMIASSGADRAVEWFSGATSTYRFEADGGVTTGVTAAGADGFTVGADNNVNNSGRTFYYVAFNDIPGEIDVGTYAGNGTTKTVTGLGFAPEYVNVRGRATVAGQHRNVAVPGSASQYFTNIANITTGITALQSDGFQTGNHTSVNTNGTTYQYIAFDNTAGGCSQPSSGDIVTASSDSWVNQASPASNLGGDSVLKVTSKDSSSNTRAFVDFDLPSLPDGCSVTAATLFLNNKSPISGRTLTAHRAAASWGENTITWSNQPAVTGTPATAITTGTAGWLGWNVTALTGALYTSGNFGFRVADQTEGFVGGVEQQFGAREDPLIPPVLQLSVGTTP